MPKFRLKVERADCMQITKVMMKGLVAKHIERRSFWHGANDIHWKLMIVKLEG